MTAESTVLSQLFLNKIRAYDMTRHTTSGIGRKMSHTHFCEVSQSPDLKTITPYEFTTDSGHFPLTNTSFYRM